MKAEILLIGHGAMAAEVRRAAEEGAAFRVGAVLVRPERVKAVAKELKSIPVIGRVEELAFRPLVAAECASHQAVREHAAALLSRGIDVIVASIGALSDAALLSDLEAAAKAGGAKLILPAGAVPGIDALNAAMVGGLEEVTYVSRKPPSAWKGTPAERELDLDALQRATPFYDGNAGEAARDYPKNANVAAAIALASLGFDRTKVRLIADPGVSENIHEIAAKGRFGEMRLEIKGRPLESNPRTSSLAAYSMVRAILNRVRPIAI